MENINNVQTSRNDRRLENEIILNFLASETNMLYWKTLYRHIYILHWKIDDLSILKFTTILIKKFFKYKNSIFQIYFLDFKLYRDMIMQVILISSSRNFVIESQQHILEMKRKYYTDVRDKKR